MEGFQELVFPTPVGVFPACGISVQAVYSLPHARGGVSGRLSLLLETVASSPRPWGCFSDYSFLTVWREVFPTPVGVFL